MRLCVPNSLHSVKTETVVVEHAAVQSSTSSTVVLTLAHKALLFVSNGVMLLRLRERLSFVSKVETHNTQAVL